VRGARTRDGRSGGRNSDGGRNNRMPGASIPTLIPVSTHRRPGSLHNRQRHSSHDFEHCKQLLSSVKSSWQSVRVASRHSFTCTTWHSHSNDLLCVVSVFTYHCKPQIGRPLWYGTCLRTAHYVSVVFELGATFSPCGIRIPSSLRQKNVWVYGMHESRHPTPASLRKTRLIGSAPNACMRYTDLYPSP
jgi:hypothetical protein